MGGPVCAVVKADAYGHGDAVVARALQQEGAAAFAVSCLGEAKRLRRHGVTVPVLILGYADPDQAPALAREDIATTCFSTEYAAALSRAAQRAGVRVKVHLKVDTGMGRLGFPAQQDWRAVVRELEALYRLPGLEICGIFQHFAEADSLQPEAVAYTDAQYALFRKVVDRLQADGYDTGVVHCANSAAQMRRPEWRLGMARAGIILYGLDPSDELHFPALRPAMTLKCLVTFVKDLLPGQSVSYGCTFTAQKPMRAATVCVGYADGYPRVLSGSQGQGRMLVNGRPAPVLGRVCMDQPLLDVTDIPGVAMGDEVTVFGPGGGDTAADVARKAGTIPYEIVCGITRRVPRVYLQDGKICKICNNLEET